MKKYIPTSVRKSTSITNIASILFFTLILIYALNVISEIPRTNISLKVLLLIAILSLVPTRLFYLIIYNYLLMKFKTNIHTEIHLEYQRVYDKLLIENYSSEDGLDYIENLRKKCSPEAFKEEYIDLMDDRDILLREF
jgi:hypothetical protein